MTDFQPPVDSNSPSSLLPSIVRTVVPVIVALLVRKGVVAWLNIDVAFISSLIAALVTLVYYIGVRIAERYQAQLGWLLGYAKQPFYVQGHVLSSATVPTPPTTTTVVQTDVDSADDTDGPLIPEPGPEDSSKIH